MNGNGINGENRAASLRSIKNELRAKYRAEREKLLPEEKQRREDKIAVALTSTIVYKSCKQILLYASTEDEISTWAIAKKALSDGKKLLYPKCEGEHLMNYYYVSSLDELKAGMFNILEPAPDKAYVPDNSDICIVPGLTYDKFGYRLGYGRGFYDRFLSDFSGVTVGLCYSDFIEGNVPKGKYDMKVDVLLTEKGIFPLQRQK